MSTEKHGKYQTTLLYPDLSYKIRGACFEIRKQYGPGQKEVIYQRLLKEKLRKQELKVETEKQIRVFSQDSGKTVGIYQPDLLVENKILVEVKSSLVSTKRDEKQLYYYLRNSKYELGFLVNFSTPKLFIKRIIYTNEKKPFLKIS